MTNPLPSPMKWPSDFPNKHDRQEGWIESKTTAPDNIVARVVKRIRGILRLKNRTGAEHQGIIEIQK